MLRSVERVSTSSNPLDQFVILAKGTKGAGCVQLIKQVLESPDVFVFGELLQVPSIQQLKSEPSYSSFYRLLEFFAYGSYSQYFAQNERLPELSDRQLHKLRLLTLVSLANTKKVISYNELLKELALSNIRDLEDLIIEACYREIIAGKLDQKNQQVEIEQANSRDIKPQQIDDMLGILENWNANCTNVLGDIESQISRANTKHESYQRKLDDIENEVASIKKTLKLTQKDAAAAAGASAAAANISSSSQDFLDLDVGDVSSSKLFSGVAAGLGGISQPVTTSKKPVRKGLRGSKALQQ